jgi:hypothetical protein
VSGPFDKYVEKAASVIADYEVSHGAIAFRVGDDDGQQIADRVLAAVGPLIQEDTRERMVAAAGRALEREDAEMSKQGNDWGSS